MKILWLDETFLLAQQDDCWPVLNKWEHVICRPLVKDPLIVSALLEAAVKTLSAWNICTTYKEPDKYADTKLAAAMETLRTAIMKAAP